MTYNEAIRKLNGYLRSWRADRRSAGCGARYMDYTIADTIEDIAEVRKVRGAYARLGFGETLPLFGEVERRVRDKVGGRMAEHLLRTLAGNHQNVRGIMAKIERVERIRCSRRR